MAKEIFTVGPVLSFRGIVGDRWRVTALIGTTSDVVAPAFEIEGRDCDEPTLLLAHKKQCFWRYDLSCDLQAAERKVAFGLRGGPTWAFTVPGKGFAPRMAYVSCNGFSDPSGMRKLVKPESAVWADLVGNHDREARDPDFKLDKEQLWHEARTQDKGLQRFHLMLMGGDQIYFDSIWEDLPKLKQWVGLPRSEQLTFPVTATLDKEIENYYFSLYATRWLSPTRKPWGAGLNGDAADAMARIPTVMMWDDHDIFDGWGSYSEAMQHSPLFQTLFKHARRAFWVFQMQHVLEDLPELVERDVPRLSRKDPQFESIDWQHHQAQDALALPLLDSQPGFTFAHQVGPVSIVVADLRTERSRTQILGMNTWSELQKWLGALPGAEDPVSNANCQHLLFLSSVPVVHPKLSLAEGLMDTFGQDHVLDSSADDLKDHWANDDHEGERKRLLETLAKTANDKLLRVSIVSGDVHVAAWGSAYRRDISPTATWAHIQQFTSSAVVHPSLLGVAERLFLYLLNSTASKPQVIDVQHVAEMMLFPGHNRYVMPARNWLALELDLGAEGKGCKLWATWRCEAEVGFSNHLQAVQPAQR
ncbi:alkaline phosphatase family protein [Pigmentiphaga aceris]|uniref:Alkaline phosphatase family protein n=1 Tax=Pigmentiphaga aceris TaxID=1940612 RepID=A0A5C0B133_9BURK|nr:alkaline phosphatase family protein [Pigmentiphaga aceris]QEI06357.1 alkaline phosphatase family protein [Pigmentiphaga aceris]